MTDFVSVQGLDMVTSVVDGLFQRLVASGGGYRRATWYGGDDALPSVLPEWRIDATKVAIALDGIGDAAR